MHSPMVTSASYIKQDDKSNYTEMKVMRSAAGYYVGTEYWDADSKFWDAGSRDSGYFETREGAEAFLKIIHAGDESSAAMMLRSHPDERSAA